MRPIVKANIASISGSLVLVALLWPLSSFRFMAACVVVLGIRRLDMWAMRKGMVPMFSWLHASTYDDEPKNELEELVDRLPEGHPYRPEPSVPALNEPDAWQRFQQRVLQLWPWRR